MPSNWTKPPPYKQNAQQTVHTRYPDTRNYRNSRTTHWVCSNVIPHSFAVHILGDENSVVVSDYPLVYPKVIWECLAIYLTHSQTLPSFVAAIYLGGAAIFSLDFGLFFLLQSIKLYSIAILLRPAALCFTIRHWVRGKSPKTPFRLTPWSAT